VKSDVV